MIENYFSEFVEFFHGEEFGIYDLSTVEFLDKELEILNRDKEEKRFKRFADKLISVGRKSDRSMKEMIHIEVDGSNRSNFARRMFVYGALIYSKFAKPLKALVIFTGSKKKHPNFFALKNGQTEMRYKFGTYSVWDQPADKLKESNNLFALIILATRLKLGRRSISEEAKADEFEWIYRKLDMDNRSFTELSTIYMYIADCLNACFENKINLVNFVDRLKSIIKNENIMSFADYLREEGIKIGEKRGEKIGEKRGEKIGEKREREKNRFDTVKKLLLRSDMPVKEIARVLNESQHFVRKVQKEAALSVS